MPAPAVPSELTHEFAELNPFRPRGDEGGEEQGSLLLESSIGGGGRRFSPAHQHDLAAQHAVDPSAPLPKQQLPVSYALRQFLSADLGLLTKDQVGPEDDSAPPSAALSQLLARPEVQVPASLLSDPSHPISSYFISSSHNTYLIGQQLVGKSSEEGYQHVLRAGACCVEIDAWDNDKDPQEPKVTHGLTLVSHIPYRLVLQTVRQELDAAAFKLPSGALQPPLLISLECHCSAQGQQRLVAIAKEELGPRLASFPHDDPAKNTLADLAGRVVYLVEWYGQGEIPEEVPADDDDDGGGGGNQGEGNSSSPKTKEKIIPELQALGLYANSIKPKGETWLKGGLSEPPNHLINIGEGAIANIIKKEDPGLVNHNAGNLVRVYPAGTRITSHNLFPIDIWNSGAQIAALNWQTFDGSLQMNDALFAGSAGFVLKPAHLRPDEQGQVPIQVKKKGKVELKIHVVGASNLPLPAERDADSLRPYVTASLYHPSFNSGKPSKAKTSAYHKHHGLGTLLGIHHHPPANQPIWNETIGWMYDADGADLVIVRLLIKSDDRFARNPVFAVTSIRATYAPKEYVFLRLLDLSGKETDSSVLVRFSVQEVV